MKTSLAKESAQALSARLARVNAEFEQRYPGETGRRQPVHTVYGGAHLFKAGLSPSPRRRRSGSPV